MSGRPRILTRHTLPRHVRALSKQCEHMARAYAHGGMPPPRKREGGFRTLLRIIVDQQISVHAGAAIWAKLEDRLGEITAKRVLAVREATLRKCGLSGQKIRYARELAKAVTSGALDLDNLHRLDDETAAQQLTQVKGIGTWTAEIYMMFGVGRPDIMPAGDLALQVATENLLDLDARPTDKDLRAIAERWRPYRTTAAIMLWQYYRKMPLRERDEA